MVNSKHFTTLFFGSLLELDFPDVEWENIYPRQVDNTADDRKMRKPLWEYLEEEYAMSSTVAECELSEQQWGISNGSATVMLQQPLLDSR